MQQLSTQVVELSDDQIMGFAGGRWQRECIAYMLGWGLTNPISALRGRAKSYSVHYQHSWHNLRARLAAAGVTVERTPGVHGGEYSAVYRIARHG